MIDAYTQLYCIIGNPIRHSFSPAIHNAAFQELGINSVYTAFEVSNLKDAVNGIRALGISGASVTIPHKVNIIPCLDGMSDIAELIGSVNTLVIEDGKIIGTNTDAFGFYRALSEKADINGKTVAVFGSGGSAKAICFALFYYARPARVIILARNSSHREEIRQNLLALLAFGDKKISPDQVEAAAIAEWPEYKDSTDIIVNTIPLGMGSSPDKSILNAEEIPEGRTVMDIVYNPQETLFIKAARQKSCKIVYGIDMLLYQGVLQFELWTGRKAPEDIMRKAIEASVYK